MSGLPAFEFSHEFRDSVLYLSKGDQKVLMIIYSLLVTSEKIGRRAVEPIEYLIQKKIRGDDIAQFYLETGGTPLSFIKFMAKDRKITLKNVR